MITITPPAAAQIRKYAQEGNMADLPLRVAVARNHDKSFKYGIGFDDASYQDDLTYKIAGINIVVSGESLALAKNMTIDFVEIEKDNFSFIFLNPDDPDHVTPRQE